MTKPFEKELVELAIDELKSKNMRVNLSAITKLTGYNYLILQRHGYGHLARPLRKVRGPSDCESSTPVELDQVDNNLEAYKAHVLENYFSKPDTVAHVKSQMANEIDGYNPSLCATAINQLIVEGKLASTGRPDYYMSQFEVSSQVVTHIVLDAEGAMHKCHSYSEAMEMAKRMAVSKPELSIQLFAAAQVVKAELSIKIQ